MAVSSNCAETHQDSSSITTPTLSTQNEECLSPPTPLLNQPISTSQPHTPSQHSDLSRLADSPFTTASGPTSTSSPWTLITSKPATFLPKYFLSVTENLIRNPNITSSCVFRADVYYDSDKHTPVYTPGHDDEGACGGGHFSPNNPDLIQQLKAEYRPLEFRELDNLVGEDGGEEGHHEDRYKLRRTVVRKLIPRNPKLDRELVQTCHFFSSSRWKDGRESGCQCSYVDQSMTEETTIPTSSLKERTEDQDCILVMLPHVEDATSIPFYHPKVRGLALRYQFAHQCGDNRTLGHVQPSSNLFIYYNLFPESAMDNRLSRTALNLLTTIHKHAIGQAAGYTKRVHHDQIVPQARFQDTYTRLKLRYAKTLSEGWAEQTDPTKHVFEDLGIAAFLVELWADMYSSEKPFPGFVDIGCGNGLLVNILIQEGYAGWGFDARARKSWATYPETVKKHLLARILVPSVLAKQASPCGDDEQVYHDGVFTPGTFIISNHADELTPWTPLVAYLNQSPFIAIPCCSHNLAGARCRFHVRDTQFFASGGIQGPQPTMEARISAQDGPGPAQGSLSRPKNAVKPPSAYQSLTSYVSNLAAELGFVAQKEMLRIPSTRNAAIVGRKPPGGLASDDASSLDTRSALVAKLVQREVGGLDGVSKDWLQRAEQIAQSTKSAH